MCRVKLGMISASMALCLAWAVETHAAVSFGFTAISNNSGQSAAVASQLFVDVYTKAEAESTFGSIGTLNGDVLFVFGNTVGVAANIAEVYFQDTSLLSQSTIYNSLAGSTSFNPPPIEPGNLPGGNSITPQFSANLLLGADVANGPPALGVNASADRLGIAFDLLGGATFQDLITAMNLGSVRIGLHVRSIGTSGGSDGFVSTGLPGPPGNSVPEPASLVVWSLLLSGVGIAVMRRRGTGI